MELQNTADCPRLQLAAKTIGQVMVALKKVKSPTGPTMREIVDFISEALSRPATKRQVKMALRRGVKFGVLKCRRGHYKLSTVEDLTDQLLRDTPCKRLDKVSKRVPCPMKTRRARAREQCMNCACPSPPVPSNQ